MVRGDGRSARAKVAWPVIILPTAQGGLEIGMRGAFQMCFEIDSAIPDTWTQPALDMPRAPQWMGAFTRHEILIALK